MGMTLKRAIKVLLDHTGRNVGGVGLGIRSLPSERERDEAISAARIAWKYAYGWEPTENDLRNMGFI